MRHVPLTQRPPNPRATRPGAPLAATLLVLALLAGGAVVRHTAGAAAAPLPPCYFVANGETAVVGWNNGSTLGLVVVQRGICRARAGVPPLNPFALGTATDTYLTYFVRECCWRTVHYGEGPIPGTDLRGGGTSRLSLHTDTSAASNPHFYRYIGSGGHITLEWQPDQSRTIRRTGMRTGRNGDFTYHWSGTEVGAAARVQGSVAGAAVSGPFWLAPWMGTSHEARFALRGQEQEP